MRRGLGFGSGIVRNANLAISSRDFGGDDFGGGVFKMTEEIGAPFIGKIDVQDREVRGFPLEAPPCFLPIPGFDRFHVPFLQLLAHAPADEFFVFDDEESVVVQLDDAGWLINGRKTSEFLFLTGHNAGGDLLLITAIGNHHSQEQDAAYYQPDCEYEI